MWQCMHTLPMAGVRIPAEPPAGCVIWDIPLNTHSASVYLFIQKADDGNSTGLSWGLNATTFVTCLEQCWRLGSAKQYLIILNVSGHLERKKSV